MKHLKVYNSSIFSIFTSSCKFYHYLILEHFLYPKNKLSRYSCFFLLPWQSLIYFLSLWICLFWRFHMYGITQYIVFSLSA